MKQIKILIKLCIFVAIFIGGIIILSDSLVEKASKNKLYLLAKDTPQNKVGLLLGTGKFLSNGRINLYYQHRIKAAVLLFNAGKIEYILVSGDNHTKEYDEVTSMKNDLMAAGIPENKIFLDYAGFRTLDSVVRSKAIFGQKSITVISQPFHNKRAIYIAKRKGIEAIGFNAQDVSYMYGRKTQVRERLARVKMVLDLVFGKQPKFLGDPIEIK